MNNNWCIRLGGVAIAVAAFLFQANVNAAVPSSAEIISITGKAETRVLASAPWGSAQNKQLLYGGNFVRTLDESSVALLFADKSQLKLARNSMFEIKGIGDGKTTDTTVSLLKGKSWMQSKSVPDKLKVQTPSGTAGIHGTDWVLEVDEAGVTTLTVLSGEVEFSNAQGSVNVRTNEQAITAPGTAPQKRFLQNSRDRVQWVTAHRVDVDRYVDLAVDPVFKTIREAVLAQRMGDARTQVDSLIRGAAAQPANPASRLPAGAWLLAADFALTAGEFDLANRQITEGATRFPMDDRFPAYQARAALLSGAWDDARRITTTAMARFPDSIELALVNGDLARLEGDGARAVSTFGAATLRAPNDYRAWHGLGTTYAEQESFGPARTALKRAIGLAPGVVAPLAELGALETRAHRLPEAGAAIDQSLELAPDDYVAWTSRGILLLSQGQPEAALEALLKAGVLEPRYAKAQVHAAIAWYQLGRVDAALAALAKAKTMDPNDPLPYFYEAQIQGDALDPMGAITAARAAMDRFGFLKSLGPIATDRQGNASLGAAYALFGLESWAKRISVQTQHPFFAGSYLFAAERSTDSFLKNSALIQGYLTDPTLFGASPQRSTLLPSPGAYVAAELGTGTTTNTAVNTATVVANGYTVSPLPMAGFVQVDARDFRPRSSPMSATMPGLTAALGLRPDAQWGLFLYRDEIRPNIDSVDVLTANDRISGRVARTDLGAQWQIDPATAIWLRAGQGSDSTQVSSNVESFTNTSTRTNSDAGIRYTALRSGNEWTLGFENGRASKPVSTAALRNSRLIESSVLSTSDGERLYASWKGGSKDWKLQADVNYSRYRFDENTSGRVTTLSTGRANEFLLSPVEVRLAVWSPSLGAAWTPSPSTTYRLAWQDVVRPASAVSLAPLDTVGISLDVPGLQPGGRLKRVRAQGEWELSASSYLTAFADQRSLKNVYDPSGLAQYSISDLAMYDSLRQQGNNPVTAPEALEYKSVFADGTIQTAGLVFEQIASDRLSWSAAYINARTTNVLYPGVPLPYFPEHTVRLGLTWFAPQRWVVRTQLSGRSERTADERGATWLDPDWDLAVSAVWQDAAKRRLLALYAKGLARKDDGVNYGVRAVWRF